MSRVNVGHVLSASIALARQAATLIRQVRASGDLGTSDKGVDDPVTRADVGAQRLIISGLRALWPSLAIVGEEDTPDLQPAEHAPDVSLVPSDSVPAEWRAVPVSELCVYLDPLDATKEFTLGVLPCVMTLIGIAVRGDPVAGVLHQPFVDAPQGGHLVYALRGMPVYGLEAPQQRARDPEHAGRFVAVTSASHGSPALAEALARCAPDAVLHEGGCGYKALLVMLGVADAYVYPQPGTKRWDTCAPEAVLRALGGDLTDAHGRRIVYATTGSMLNDSLVASRDAATHQRVVKALAKH